MRHSHSFWHSAQLSKEKKHSEYCLKKTSNPELEVWLKCYLPSKHEALSSNPSSSKNKFWEENETMMER
jgi:hypothetical protein